MSLRRKPTPPPIPRRSSKEFAATHRAPHRGGQGARALSFLKQAGYLKSFRENPVKARGAVEFFYWISAQVRECFQPVAPHVWMEAQQMARQVRRLAGG